jgi:hypothetical protein
MGTAFEIGLILNLQPELASEDVETLEYMTRSQDYDFQTLLDDALFTESDEWRSIIANTEIEYEQKYRSQLRRSVFSNNQLCFRIEIGDDWCWGGPWDWFSDWLFLISTDEGLVGYMIDITKFKTELIYFEKSGITLQVVVDFKVSSSLVDSLSESLGGAGNIDFKS